ncbi:TetR/AcrR family transcriptional regulator [Shewanella mesophila]|uniref:TetR/AcrR family transcriptional regulator n=1 Tax=Shewanella mesophila TaxID=2864208 RepID=UPI001C65F674|nr:TetR/AcrR family transcriptional regulator [Shewanella mesophila]QYJ87216.1 TetR/AcrR family transcriptional regulator [Shewanella mesophila]
MARVCNFDRQEKLVLAMELFWQKGYADTSVADLVAKLQINRFSLYNSFGDKLSLYREALTHYLENYSQPNLSPLLSEEADVNDIIRYIEAFIALQSSQPYGCFLQNAVLEKYLSDQVVQQICARLFNGLHQAFVKVLMRSQALAQIDSSINTPQLASFLIMQLQGIRVLGKAKQYALIEDARQVLLTYIGGLKS